MNRPKMSKRWVSLTLPRRIIADLCHFSLSNPRGVICRKINIAKLVAARGELDARPAWPVLFMKAFALVAQEMPELRRSYVKLPVPHFHESAISVASLVIERDHEGEAALFLARIKQPEFLPVTELDAVLKSYKSLPVGEVRDFRRALMVARLPLLLRRLIWWLGLNIGRQRAGNYGTFAISVLASQGAEIVYAVSLWTTLLSYGVIGRDGDTDVTISFDHRVMDGALIAGALQRIETVMNDQLAKELARK